VPETYTPFTWVDGAGGGTPITAARLNSIEQGVESMDDRVTALEAGGTTFRVATMRLDGVNADGSGRADLAVPATTDTTVPLAYVADAQGLHATTNGILIPEGAGGYYDVEWRVKLTGGTAGERASGLKVNGDSVISRSPYGSGTMTTDGSGVIKVEDGDVITLWVYSAQATNVVAAFDGDTYIRLTRRQDLPVSPILTGWSGDTAITGTTQQIMGSWGSRTTWSEVANLEYVSAPDSDVREFIAANPGAALDLGVPLIPHDQADTTWNTHLDAVVAGTHDADHTSLGAELAGMDAGTVYARLWWEADIDTTNLDVNKFKAAWAHAVPVIRAGFDAAKTPSQQLKIVFCYIPDKGLHRTMYPGDAYVDVIAADVYAWIWGTTNPTLATLLSTIQERLDTLSRFAAEHGKPVAIGEWGNAISKTAGPEDTRGLGDVPEIIDLFFDWAEQVQCEYLVYFNLADGGVGQTMADTPLSLARYQDRVSRLY
jgi:hypothetical protein